MAGGSSSKGSSNNHHQFKVGDVVLAKIRGFPAWPGVLVGGEQVPRDVQREKPKDKFIIRFFPKADYHFPGHRDLTLLTRDECRAYAEDSHRKDGELKEAYKIGSAPEEWIKETDAVVLEAERAREEAEMEAQENQDQLEDDDELKPEKPASGASKKKRAAPAKPSTASKSKKAKTEPASGSSKAAAPVSGGAARKSAGAAGEDDGEAGELDEDTKKVRNWRHSLQRAFLPKDRAANEEDVKDQHTIFSTVESADITSEQLKATKIGKVMRKIIGLSSVPLDEVHHFKQRAEALVNKWNAVQAGGSAASPAIGETKAAEAKTEGTNGNGSQSAASAPAPADASASADVGDLTELKDDEPTQLHSTADSAPAPDTAAPVVESAPVNGSA
ncbi:hypothetical protein BDZ90DRAFT_231708 [Jaminaea rosea]|uniref:PWWP domain-containing protein n=1 Tax=Jaminaea rosea TaxID=1569628 RepID=A0A316URL3_9BASI|nr:hypothetical protein BDZ90DRAFT_231708 [Jaminaea rosea]PWN27932.1 hypothetical protein BDZ90DRAFT_231708 [Jaminaea rosea]